MARRLAGPPRVAANLVDRLIGYFNPQAGFQRLQARAGFNLVSGSTGGYRGGKRDRRSTRYFRPGSGSADADTIPDLPDLRARTRDLARNNMIGGGAISTNVTSVVGEGLRVLPQVDRSVVGLDDAAADAWDQAALREFRIACKTLDATDVQTFEGMQDLALRSALESGDVFALRRFRRSATTTYKTRIQLIEADRISNPNRRADTSQLVDGVRRTRDGRHLGYWLANGHPGDQFRAALNWRYIPRETRAGDRVMLHLFTRLRPDQTRGVPYLAPVIEALKQIGDYTDAEVSAAVLSSMFTAFITTPTGDPDEGPFLPQEAADASGGADEIELDGGAKAIHLALGEDVAFADPKRPNSGFDTFTLAFLQQVGVALELPLELLVKHFTASYSASRAALEMAWAFFRKRRAWLAQSFCQPVYEFVIEEAVVMGRIDAPGFFDATRPEIRAAYLNASWIGPARPFLDPLKEANADRVDIETGVKTRDEVCHERTGGTFDGKHRQLVKEAKARGTSGLGASVSGGGSAAPDDVPPTDREDEE